MTVAEAACAERGQRLTPLRRKVLSVLLGSHQPLGAYDIMERLAPGSPRPAPITVYRALDFLCENGFVHRIESRNAYLACVRPHMTGDLTVFLICERCGAVGEASSPEVAATIKSAACSAGFTPKSPVIEIGGVCTHCGRSGPSK
jgi:Fur family transcriptional regulator, zinc uptake regulator